jgi:hypothetical protein
MPLFFFDVKVDDKPRDGRDDVGTDHSSKECIPAETADLLATISRDHLDGSHRSFSVSVRDTEDSVIYKAKLTFEAGWQ